MICTTRIVPCTRPRCQMPPLPLQSNPWLCYIAPASESYISLKLTHSLFDLPIANIPDPSTRRPHYIPSLTAVQSVATALRLFRDRIPVPFQDRLQPLPLSPSESYDGPGDPWWVALHANLLLAEIMMWKEMAHYDKQGYDKAVMCARAMVSLVKRLRSDCYINLREL